MLFNYVLGHQEVNKEKVNVNYREAVRAIVLQNNNILMVYTNKGDYKFPGGGVKKEENHQETLKREIREETGYIVSNVRDKIGIVTERKLDEYEENSVFEMISYYYLCELSNNITDQQLDDYESELDFKPVWIQLDKAIHANEEILKNDNNKNNWVYRETSVLKILMEYYYN